MPTQKLESFLSGRWSGGEGIETQLADPVSGEELATASARGLDLNAALS
jgi:3,4-dehydroadipyl-CoA semialdehyde dehydrogenase